MRVCTVIEYQLQLWDGNAYRPDITGAYEPVQAAFEKLAGVARRLVRVDKAWPLKPRKNWHKGGVRYSRSAEAVAAEYLDWAMAHGRKRVAMYASGGPHVPVSGALTPYYVNPADFLGPVPSEETEFAAEPLAA